jgi:hypothetical protein
MKVKLNEHEETQGQLRAVKRLRTQGETVNDYQSQDVVLVKV